MSEVTPFYQPGLAQKITEDARAAQQRLHEQLDRNTLRITVEGLPNSGKVTLSLLIVELLQGLGLSAERMKGPDPAGEVLGLDKARMLQIVEQLKERGIHVQVREQERPYQRISQPEA